MQPWGLRCALGERVLHRIIVWGVELSARTSDTSDMIRQHQTKAGGTKDKGAGSNFNWLTSRAGIAWGLDF